jgi:hypothetical protein
MVRTKAAGAEFMKWGKCRNVIAHKTIVSCNQMRNEFVI